MKSVSFSTGLRVGAVILALVGMGAGPALAQERACTAPVPPEPLILPKEVKPKMPARPACASSNRCRAKEVDAYNAQIDQYNAKLFRYQEAYDKQISAFNVYIASLNAYSSDVTAYANCERRRLMVVIEAP